MSATKPVLWPYNPLSLTFYDYIVLDLSAHYVWKCPLSLLQALYDENIGSRHLEIGVGTGYLLDHCKHIPQNHDITLLDINPAPLQRARKRLRRYRTQTCLTNVMDKLPFKEGAFDSVGMNFVLHCLPGSQEKMKVFSNIRDVMSSGSTLFGSTVLGIAKDNNIVARSLMKIYNTSKAFHNEEDTAEEFIKHLKLWFSDVDTEIIGGVLKFVARV